MEREKAIDKARLVMFTDALLAIIMTVLVLDIKVPEGMADMSGEECFANLVKVYPHFLGFIISFSFILVLWFSHHDLMESIAVPNRTFTILNFCFIGATATLPFSTALAAAYPYQSYAVATLALNMFVMNIFFTSLFLYSKQSGISDLNYAHPRLRQIKKWIGISGVFIFVLAIFVAFHSPSIALVMISLVPILHIIAFKAV